MVSNKSHDKETELNEVQEDISDTNNLESQPADVRFVYSLMKKFRSINSRIEVLEKLNGIKHQPLSESLFD